MRILLTSLFAFALSGCASSWPQTAELSAKRPQDLPARLELADVPFFPQVEYQCGPAALATALASSGVAVTPGDLVSQVYIPARKGSLQIEMMAAARRRGQGRASWVRPLRRAMARQRRRRSRPRERAPRPGRAEGGGAKGVWRSGPSRPRGEALLARGVTAQCRRLAAPARQVRGAAIASHHGDPALLS